ncbi:MAG: ATP-binding protein [Alphaproteobacteria bacterium]|nr:ATP-binding protein [Alphaproteobacteria bacterium]
MSQVLDCLVISGHSGAQQALEQMKHIGGERFTLNLSTRACGCLAKIEHAPDLFFFAEDCIDDGQAIGMATARFPNTMHIVLKDASEEERRKLMAIGVDEVIGLGDLASPVGHHLLEKLLVYQNLEKAEQRAEQSEERFRGIIEHSHDIIMLLDAEGTVIYVSPAFERQMEYEHWEVLGQELAGFIHEEDRVAVRSKLHKLTSVWASDGMVLTYRFARKDGTWRDFETVATNLLNTETVKAVVLNSRDMTEQIRTQTALEKERELVEQQRIFISMVSHEFRTPLTIIDGNAQIIERRGESMEVDKLKERASVIRRGVTRLIGLIETILSAHAVESGMLSLNLAPCHVKDLIGGICQEYQDFSSTHVIHVDMADDIPDVTMLDEKIFRHVLGNLLSNAIKYSPGKEQVDVKAWREEGEMAVKVADRGLGIPKDEVSRLFSKYYRASTAGSIPGTGIGLTLVKQFVELHNGHIALESVLGEGTTVTVRLPVVAPGESE